MHEVSIIQIKRQNRKNLELYHRTSWSVVICFKTSGHRNGIRKIRVNICEPPLHNMSPFCRFYLSRNSDHNKIRREFQISRSSHCSNIVYIKKYTWMRWNVLKYYITIRKCKIYRYYLLNCKYYLFTR